MNLALFDFDGTITYKESIADFLKYVLGPKEFYLRMLGIYPNLIGYLLGKVGNREIKEVILSATLKGKDARMIREKGQEYAKERLMAIIRRKAMDRIRWHQDQGDKVIIVSAGLKLYIEPWARSIGVEQVIAMELEENQGVLTGRLIGENCYGKEKVRRINELVDLEDFDKIYAYGDSPGDKEMLAIADEAYYRIF